ncbi:putative Lariat debranching enzyme [Blattamonas nauphoetae]|uniref:Lariat debranching enzyme n=1 Tax=Blattamonas nauphoetae TaxID=2049346 RepID=A0ABQ9Y678_9EUKA|nr:putative Lariat debranching enzyme [Blattamonas nauphoetae]
MLERKLLLISLLLLVETTKQAVTCGLSTIRDGLPPISSTLGLPARFITKAFELSVFLGYTTSPPSINVFSSFILIITFSGEVPVPPYISVGRKASAFHCRSFTGEMIKALSPTAHILMVHDWSVDAARNGDTNTLLKHRPAFREDVNQNKLGSPLTAELIQHFRPSYCFASHMHYKFQASIPHTTSLFPDSRSATTFLALDKMTEPFEKAKGKQRQSIQLITFPRSALPRPGAGLEYDPEWLSLIRIVHPHVTLSLRSEGQFTVGSMWYPLLSFLERTTGRTTEDRMKEEVAWVQTNVPNLAVPFNFEREAHRGLDLDMKERWTEQGRPRTLPPLPTTGRSDGAYAQFSKNLPFSTFESSPQTTALLTKLGLVPFPATFDDFFQLAQRNPKTPFAPHAASSAADAMPAPAPLEVSKNDEEIEL